MEENWKWKNMILKVGIKRSFHDIMERKIKFYNIPVFTFHLVRPLILYILY